jgi:hypothetical protein
MYINININNNFVIVKEYNNKKVFLTNDFQTNAVLVNEYLINGKPPLK